MQLRVGIIGASGYAGMEATHLLARHPHATLAFLGSDRWAGRCARDVLGIDGEAGALVYAPPAAWEEAELDAVLLATPEDVSLQFAPRILEKGVRVIDLSPAFRKGGPAVYGLSERYRHRLADARFVANPGCYPTAILLALVPLLEARLLRPDEIVVHAVSGATGAGRRASEDWSFCELSDDVRAYGILGHRHLPELRRILGEAAGEEVDLVFTPTLLPIRRGILATSVGRLVPGADADAVLQAYRSAYADAPFVSLAAAPGEVGIAQVVGTNLCRIGFAVQGDRFLACSAIDNLVKGAAGQAVQNLNLACGWDEGAGLRDLRRFRP